MSRRHCENEKNKTNDTTKHRKLKTEHNDMHCKLN